MIETRQDVHQSPSERSAVEFIPIDLRHFVAGRPPLLDLYHVSQSHYILYCKATAVFTDEARLRLIANNVSRLYARVSAGRIDAGELDLPSLLGLPDNRVPQRVKASLVYHSAIASAKSALTAGRMIERIEASESLVNTTVSYMSSNLDTFSPLVEMMRHDFGLYSHAVNVCTYATSLGIERKLERALVVKLGLAAFLHDIGKTKIAATTLAKPEPLSQTEWQMIRRHPEWSACCLTDGEWAIYRQHPEWGVQILGSDGRNRPIIRDVILQHHERMDGSGYPEKLVGAQISTLARIVGLVDVYDTLTSDRPFQKALDPFGALNAIGQMGKQFDQEIFVSFIRLLGRNAKSEEGT